MKLVKAKEFFLGSPIISFNRLLNQFPSFDPTDFSEFIEEGEEIPAFINYYLHQIYPILKYSIEPNHIESLKRMKELLDQLSHDSIADLWQQKMPLLVGWYQKIESPDSYFEILSKKQILNTIIYLYYKYLQTIVNDDVETNSFRLAASLLVYLSDEEFEEVSSHHFFNDMLGAFEKLFSEVELKVFFKINPKLANYVRSNHEESFVRYFTTLHLSEESDIDSIISLIQTQYLEFQSKLESNVVDHNDFFSEKGKVFLKMEYLITLIRTFPKERMRPAFERVTKDPFIQSILKPSAREIIHALISEDFVTLDKLLFPKK